MSRRRRVVTVTFNSAPDDLGRRRFTADWEEPDGDFRPQPHPKDGEPVGHRRGQCFFAVPEEHIARWRARGERVVVLEESHA